MSMFNYRNATPAVPAYNNGGYAPNASKPVAPATLMFYQTLCNEKGEPAKLDGSSSQLETQQEIDRLKKLPNFRPMSEAQRNKIIGRCQEIGMNCPPLETMSMAKASDFIVKLDAKYVEMGLDKIITPKQVEMIKNMSICPDIPVYTLFLPVEMLDKGENMQLEYNNLMHAVNTGKAEHSVLDAYEADMRIFESECMAISEAGEIEKVDRENASMFIQAFQQKYYAWRNTRASEGKRNLLKQLFTRQGTEMSDDELMQYDNASADKMINQLQMEMGMNFGGTLEELAKELKVQPKTPIDVQKHDHEKLQALIHSLYAIVGQIAEDDTLQNPSIEVLADLCDMLKFGFIDEKDLEEMLDEVFTIEERNQIMKVENK